MNSDNTLVQYRNAAVPALPYPGYEWGYEEEGGSGFSLLELRAMLYRQRYWLVGTIILALALGLIVTLLTTPIYRGTSSVQIEANVPVVEEGQEAVEPQITAQNMQQFLAGQVDVLKSRNIAMRVADKLALVGSPVFLDAMNIDLEGTKAERREQVIAALQENLVVDLPIGSQVARINFDSPDPRLSAAIANAYAENLITGNLERRYQASSYARQFLLKEMNLAKQRLEASERGALAYAKQAQIVDTGSSAASGGSGASSGGGQSGGGGSPSLSASSLMQMNGDLATARTARIQAEQRWRAASNTPVMNLPEVLDNPTINSLQGDRARLNSNLSKLRQTFTDDYPDVVRLKSEIAGINTQISAIASQILNSIRERYEVAARQESGIASRMGGLKSETLQEQDRRVQYDILNREAATNRELYTGLLQRYRQVSTAAGVVNNNISILDQATSLGAPIRPRPIVNMALALVAGLGLGFLIAFVRDHLDDSVHSPDDVQRKLELPLLGTTPALGRGAVKDQLAHSRSGISEAYHSIRSSIEFAAGEVPRSLLVTSSRSGEGKSTTAVALAADFARFGKRVLLVDADLRLPSLHKAMGGENQAGLVHVLTGKLPLDEAVRLVGDVTLLTSGPIPPNPTELLSPMAMTAFLKKAGVQFDIIVLDGPPVMGLADAPQLARAAEATVLVVEASRAGRSHAKTAIRRLRAAGGGLIGVVLTKFSARTSGYNDDYGYYYQYGTDRKQLGGG